MKDINNESGEEKEAREALTGASGKILIYNLETAMWKNNQSLYSEVSSLK